MQTARPGQVRWNQGEKDLLARHVATLMLRYNMDPTQMGRKEAEEIVGPFLQRAAANLMPSRRKAVTPADVAWAADLAIEMFRARAGHKSRFAADLLVAPPKKLPHFGDVESQILDTDQEYTIPPGFSLIEDRKWSYLVRKMTRLRKAIRRLESKLDMVADHLTDPRPGAPKHLPFVLAVGVPEGRISAVREVVGDAVEVVFVDPRKVPPQDAGECDLLVALSSCPGRWLERAREIYGDRVRLVDDRDGRGPDRVADAIGGGLGV